MQGPACTHLKQRFELAEKVPAHHERGPIATTSCLRAQRCLLLVVLDPHAILLALERVDEHAIRVVHGMLMR